MSISDGLGPPNFCRGMEKARPLRERVDGKVVYFPPFLIGIFYFGVLIYKVLFPIFTLTWRVNNFVCREETL